VTTLKVNRSRALASPALLVGFLRNDIDKLLKVPDCSWSLSADSYELTRRLGKCFHTQADMRRNAIRIRNHTVKFVNAIVISLSFVLVRIKNLGVVPWVDGLESVGVASHCVVCKSGCDNVMLWFDLIGDCVWLRTILLKIKVKEAGGAALL
jgi:hypothetical protein